MTSKLLFQVFLIGIAASEWVEITKVVNSNEKNLELPKVMSSTPPSFEDILAKPQGFYEISANTEENYPKFEEILLPSTPEVFVLNNTQHSEDAKDETLYKDNKVMKKEHKVTSKENIDKVAHTNLSATENILKSENTGTNQSFVDDKDDSKNENSSKTTVKNNFSENDSSPFPSVLKHIQENLLNYKERSLKGKIVLLNDLRDNMLYEIKTRMSKLWLRTSDDEQTRGYKDYDDHYHMDFPSNEGALMTIGFLTFAVFLIKLVLKLIYTLKVKQQYYYPTTTTTAASVFLKRNEREITEDQRLDQSAKIMQYIEEYPLS